MPEIFTDKVLIWRVEKLDAQEQVISTQGFRERQDAINAMCGELINGETFTLNIEYHDKEKFEGPFSL